MAEKIAAKNKNVSQIGLNTHNQDHEMNPAAFSTTKSELKQQRGRVHAVHTIWVPSSYA